MRFAYRALRVLVMVLAINPVVAADTYPSRSIKAVVPQSAGSPPDVRARQIADRLSKSIGQPVIVENRPGAGGTIGAEYVAKSPPDGYTLLYGIISDQSIAPAFYLDLPYNPRKDFAPITLNALTPAILVVNSSLGVHSVKELVALAKAKPGQLTGGSYGNGTMNHLLLLQLGREAGINFVHVPYKSASNSMADLVSGQISIMFDYYHTSGSSIASGRIVPLMVVGHQRIKGLPNVPSAAEVGLPNIKHRSWTGYLAPAGTPKDIIKRLNAELVKALRTPELVQKLAESGGETIANSPEEFAAFIAKEQDEMAELVKVTGAKME
jgi:tripartite-type tricarboxylate transporter receptor subunit TctC